jgi:hypothetical protein
VWSLALLGFSKKGIQEENCPMMHKFLKADDINVLMKIFSNNNKTIFLSFLKNKFTKKLWPVVISQMNMKDTFKLGCDQDMIPTYKAITKDIQQEGLTVPAFWNTLE